MEEVKKMRLRLPKRPALHARDFFVMIGIVLLLGVAKLILARMFKNRDPMAQLLDEAGRCGDNPPKKNSENPPFDPSGIIDMARSWTKTLRRLER